MHLKDPFPSLFDGLPLLSSKRIGAMGLFLLRASYLLFSLMPLVLSMLDAIAGIAAEVLYSVGMLALCLPLVLDVISRLGKRRASLDSLVVLCAVLFLVWNQNYLYAVSFAVFYHVVDLSLCLLIRLARATCEEHTARILQKDAARPLSDCIALCAGERIRVEAGEVLAADCRIQEGGAICSLCFLDPDSGEFEAGAGDVLFAGTRIEEGGFSGTVLSVPNDGATRAVRAKLARALSLPSKEMIAASRFAVPLQTFYLLLILLNVTFFDVPIGIELLSFSSVFFCIDIFLRAHRALELSLLSLLLKKGIYPESLSCVCALHQSVFQLRVLKPQGKRRLSGGRFYRVKGRMPRKAPVVLENASEFAAWIARCDFALMYRTKEELFPLADAIYERVVLFRLLTLLTVVFASIAFLILSLSLSVLASCLILGSGLVFCCLMFGFSVLRLSKQ